MPVTKTVALGGLVVIVLAMMPRLPADAQSAVVLAGQVTSAEEGPMEGVLVSAKRHGSTVSVTVVSNERGDYSFPAARLEPGRYSLRIRAIGYDLDRPVNVDVIAQQSTKLDLKLRKTEDLAAQLSNGEWLASFPGTDQQKNAMLGCVGCHTLERVARSTHKPDDFINVTLPRMQGYVNQSIPAAPQLRRGERRMEERGEPASIGSTWPPARSRRGSRSRTRPRASRTTSTMSFRIPITMRSSPISAGSILDGSMRRPGK